MRLAVRLEAQRERATCPCGRVVDILVRDDRVVYSRHFRQAGRGFCPASFAEITPPGVPALPEKCKKCRGFGYTKGGPEGPWEKLECPACGGTGVARGNP